MEKRDYKNYDYLCVTVKREALAYLESFYLALGYETIEEEEHRIYFNEINVTFRRPHKVKNKDRLQLLQIYIESLVNDFGKYSSRRRPHALAFGISTCFLSAALVALGLALAFAFGIDTASMRFIWGISAACSGAALFTVFYFLALHISRREGEYRKLRSGEIMSELNEIIKRAKPLLAANAETGARSAEYAPVEQAEGVSDE